MIASSMTIVSRGHCGAVPAGLLVEGDLADEAKLTALFRERKIDAVMHFAALALVGESVEKPELYYRNNVLGSFHLLEAMRQAGVRKIVFSSTTATYGTPEKMPIAETTPQQPINPYGFSKLVVERMLDDYAAAHGFGFAALRYFNAAGRGDGWHDRRRPHARIAPDPDRAAGRALVSGRRSAFLAMTIPRPTALVSAIMCMSMIWPRRIWRRSSALNRTIDQSEFGHGSRL